MDDTSITKYIDDDSNSESSPMESDHNNEESSVAEYARNNNVDIEVAEVLHNPDVDAKWLQGLNTEHIGEGSLIIFHNRFVLKLN